MSTWLCLEINQLLTQARNAKPTGLTVAQRQIAAPPEGGQPASPLYQFFDISHYQNDWKPTIRQIMDRPEYGTEYVELDNGFWYLLELDGSFTHMTDHEFQDFLKWKKEQEAGENGGGDDNDLDTSMEDWDGEGEDGPDPSLSMLNSEIEALDAEMKDFDSELKRSS